MYSMIRNLDAIKERRYRIITNQIQYHNQVQNNITRQPSITTSVQSRGLQMVSPNKRTISMIGISSYKSSGSGCGCGS